MAYSSRNYPKQFLLGYHILLTVVRGQFKNCADPENVAYAIVIKKNRLSQTICHCNYLVSHFSDGAVKTVERSYSTVQAIFVSE